MEYYTKLQKTMAKYDGQEMTDKLFNQIKIDACLLIGQGITDRYYEKTFGPNGKVKTLEDAAQYVKDAASGTGSFNEFAVRRGMRRKASPHENEDLSSEVIRIIK